MNLFQETDFLGKVVCYSKSCKRAYYCVLLYGLLFSAKPLSGQQSSPDSIYFQAHQHITEGKYVEAIDLFKRYLKEIIPKKDSLKIGNAINGIGIAYDKSGNYEEALHNYYAARKCYEAVHNIKKEAGALKNIGNVYRELKNYGVSIGFFEQALQKLHKIQDSTAIANVFNDMGILYMDQDKNTAALKYFRTNIKHYLRYMRDEVKAYSYNNLAMILSRLGNYKESLNYFTVSLKLMEEKNDEYGIALILGNMADLYLKQGLVQRALQYSNQTLKISERLGSKELMLGAYKNMVDCYNSLHDYRRSNRYLLKQLDLKDTIYKSESARNYAELETRYRNEVQQKEILLLQQETTEKNTELSNQRRNRNLLIMISVFLIVLVASVYRNYVLKQRANKALNRLNADLDEANESKNKLFSIIAHDLRSPVSNLFNFLQLQKEYPGLLTSSQQEEANKQITAAAENVLEAMEDLLIWSKTQMDSFQPFNEKVALDGLFEGLIDLNTAAAVNKNIRLRKECPTGLSLVTDPNCLKVIIRNLVSNAIKFTPSNGEVVLSGARHQDLIYITVKDNGPGINSGDLANIFEWNSIRSDSSGLGLKLAKEFTEKLHGSIAVRSQINTGTEFVICFSPS
ncbi:MAG: tetratricopeptide repeat-containing sensor histidine kinase [Williamsia sp.]|nr:tetratricopeptide repeat-containing sensor histidine kinase [Williamsia sp.]